MKYLIFSIFILLCSCKCNQDVYDSGIISEFTVSNLNCGTINNPGDNYIVRSDSEFISLFHLDTSLTCSSAITDSIDFNSHSLISFRVYGGCSFDKITRTITRDDLNKKIIYKITLDECGSCMKQTIMENTVIIDKVPEDYEIIFKQ